MHMEQMNLTAAEWNLMECLWEQAPRSGREAVEYMKRHTGWSRSTTLTMLRRMTEKGLIAVDDSSGVLMYSPLVRKEDAAEVETRSFIDRVYQGSVGMMLSAMTKKQQLSKDEIEELYDILRKAEEGK
ncbi:MAG: BlaI/MecI/CopY family transcriptional regulator [Oscillospiraceae bacterium]|nr:BlaI/MecI/CopY family transcriptional regulator [Oscillospiraceae bacterium]